LLIAISTGVCDLFFKGIEVLVQKFIYFFYYLKHIDWQKYKKFCQLGEEVTGKSTWQLYKDAIVCTFRYNISPIDYFIFRFFELTEEDRSKWAGTGYMYEFQKLMNPVKFRAVLNNKILFNDLFKSFIKREFTTLSDLITNNELAEVWAEKAEVGIVLKNSVGQAGRQIKVLKDIRISSETLISIMHSGHYDLAEDFIIQHPIMMSLSDSGVNTIRIITQEQNGRIDLMAARIRISINSKVDNLAAGNAAAPIDLETGIVTGPAVFSDITKSDISFHPVSGARIIGFQVPLWQQVVEMVIEAALLIPENRSVGWDVAITSHGPLIIEGNHNWCKLLWQLPVKKGLKEELEVYI